MNRLESREMFASLSEQVGLSLNDPYIYWGGHWVESRSIYRLFRLCVIGGFLQPSIMWHDRFFTHPF
jgi:hypothetical protein